MPTEMMSLILMLEAHFQELLYWERTFTVGHGIYWKALEVKEDSREAREQYDAFAVQNRHAIARDIEECIRQWDYENSLHQGV